MKKDFLLAGFLSASVLPASALDFIPDGVNLSYGQYLPLVNNRTADYHNYRLAVVWDWDADVALSENLKLDGYFELAGSLWKGYGVSKDKPATNAKDQSRVISFSPVLRLTSRQPVFASARPFLDIGAGAAWLSEINLEKELTTEINMGGRWQFELRLMAGMQFGERQQYELSYGWYHYSNAGINEVNESMDFHLLTFGWRW